MKQSKYILIFIIIFVGIISCVRKNNVIDQTYYYEQIINDINTELKIANDSIDVLNNIIKEQNIKQENLVNNLKNCDSTNVVLRQDLFVANYKLGRIKEYCDIVKRDNSQLKFLRGWINRVLED